MSRRKLASGFAAVLLAVGVVAAGASGPEAPTPLPQAERNRPAEFRGLIDGGHYQEAESAARALLLEVEGARGPDSLDTARVLDLLVEALWRDGEAYLPASRKLAERAVAIKEEKLESDHPELAVSLRNLANMLEGVGVYADAKRLHERALVICEKALGPDHPDVAASLAGLGRVLWRISDYGGARALHERALAIREKALGPDHLDVAESLAGLASTLSSMGDYLRAKQLHERALAIREKILDPSHPDVASSLFDLTTDLQNQGDWAGAKRVDERALAIRKASLAPGHPAIGKSMASLALDFYNLGDYPAAKPLFEGAITILEGALGPDNPQIAWVLDWDGILLWHMGDYAAARSLFERCLEVRDKAFGRGHLEVARSLSDLGLFLYYLGDYAAAKPNFERALLVFEKALAPESYEVGMVLNNLGQLLGKTGDYAAARPMCERAVAIFQKILQPNDPDLARILNTLATLLRDMGDDAAARRVYERAIAIWEKAPPPGYLDSALDFSGLGEMLLQAGDAAAARPLLERSLAVRERILGPDHPDVALSLNALARLEWMSGAPERALQRALRAEQISRGHFQLTARSLAEREALGYAGIRASGLDVMFTVLGSAPSGSLPAGTAGKVWNDLIQSRAMVLDEMAGRHRTSIHNESPDVAALAAALESARGRLAHLVVRGPGGGDPGAHLKGIMEARDEKERAERVLAEKSASFRQEQERTRAGLAEVRRALPAGSALVAYAQFRRLAAPAPSSSRATPRSKDVPSYAALVFRSGETSPTVVMLGAAAGIDARIRRWSEAVAQAPRELAVAAGGAEGKYRAAGERLREAIWDPVARHLKGVRQVFVVPDGALSLVSFATLPAGEGRYLVESGPQLHYLSAERDLVREAKPRGAGNGLLVLGGPDYDSSPEVSAETADAVKAAGDEAVRGAAIGAATQPAVAAAAGTAAGRAALYRGATATCADFRSLKFKPLPGAWLEAREVEALWKEQTTVGKTRPGDVLELMGHRAAEGAFKKTAAGRRVVHLATHAFFAPGGCESALERGEGQGNKASAGGSTPLASGDNPLLLSGLALAGANRRNETKDEAGEDGILTAEEIASLDLSGVEWAVLSACETGVGKVQAGEGVLGLRRAFEVAGAGTLIMSLWSVEDESAREWMKNLYAARLGGSSTAEAVRAASLKVIEARRRAGRSTHPAFWGAFVAAGDWR